MTCVVIAIAGLLKPEYGSVAEAIDHYGYD